MEFTKPQIIKNKLNELRASIYDYEEDLLQWSTRTGQYTGEGVYSDVEVDWQSFEVGDTWIPAFHLTRWFKRQVEIPAVLDGKKVFLDLNTGGEGLVRVDGTIVSGLSSYSFGSLMDRSRVLLTENAKAGQVFDVEVEASLNYGEKNLKSLEGITDIVYTFEKAKMVIVNEEAESCWFDINTTYEAMLVLKNPMSNITNSALLLDEKLGETLETITKDDYVYSRVADALISAVSCLDFDMGREALLAGVPKARKVLAKKLKAINAPGHALIRFVGQGHIDTAWLWTIRESVRKTARTMSNVLALMDQYPDFTFAFSQPQLFEFMKEHYPEIYERMKVRIAEGRLELVGNAWVEMDVNIPSGETLIRQLLYGRAFFMKEFGQVSDVYYMPDVFGYTWALPQIIKRSGIKYFFTSKIVHNEVTRFPHSLFNWQGVDGTRVMSYMQRINYNGLYTPKTIDSLYRRFDEKHISENLLMTYGYGDGGGGPVHEMIETGKRLQEFPGLQKTQFGTAIDFFKDNEAVRDELPTWNDEMYFEMHRGTFTAQAKTKKYNRESELLYRKAEIAASMAMLVGTFDSPNAELLPGYKRLLTNQFHDILPGSSIAEVYDEIDGDYANVQKIGEKVLDRARKTILENVEHQIGDIAVFNYLSWQHRGYVYIENAPYYTAVKDKATGKTTPCVHIERDGRKYLCFEAEVAPLGIGLYELVEPTKTDEANIAKDAYCLENEYLKISINENGELAEVYDKEADRQVLIKPSNVLAVYEDKPAQSDAWDIDLEYRNKKWCAQIVTEPQLIHNSPMMAIVRVKRSFHESTFTQDIILRKGSKRIDFETHANWQERQKLLKAEFALDILANKATYEIQFGAIERSTYGNTSQDRAKFEVCGHKWADMSESGYGVAILNNCKYGYDAIENNLRLTLLTASVQPDPQADIGDQYFTYSLLPHTSGWQEANVVQAGYELNVPLEGFMCKDEVTKEADCTSMIAGASDNVIVDTVKAAEDGRGLIIRVYEAVGSKTNTSLQTGFDLADVIECNMMEDDETNLLHNTRSFDFCIKPYEIKTFRLMLNTTK